MSSFIRNIEEQKYINFSIPLVTRNWRYFPVRTYAPTIGQVYINELKVFHVNVWFIIIFDTVALLSQVAENTNAFI